MKFKFSKQKVRGFLNSCATHGAIFCFLLTQSYGQFAFANPSQPVFYIVKKGDTLSQILQALNLRPIYGKSGSLSRFLFCRESKNYGNLIKQGETIHLLYAVDPLIKNYVKVRASGKIVIAGDWLKSKAHVERQRRLASAKSSTNMAPNLKTPRDPFYAENNFENLCPGLESKTTANTITSKNQLAVSTMRSPQSAVASSAASEMMSKQEALPSMTTDRPINRKNGPAGDTNSRSFFLVEAASVLTRQDLRTNADGYSELLSKASPGLRIQWREEVSATWDLDLSYSQYSSNQIVPQGSALSGDSSFTEFAVAGLWNFKQPTAAETSRWSIGPILKYRTEPITARLSGSSIRAESPQLMLIGASLENESDLGSQKKTLRLQTGLSAWYAPRASQSDFVISNGYGLSADIRLLRPIGRQLDLSGGISYGLSRLKSSLGEHAAQQVIFGLGLVYRFGDFQDDRTPLLPTQPTNENGGLR